jgi:A/G-specific adenine glycosylase
MQKLPFDVEALKNWFQKTKRHLPWRVNPSPYAVWVSEIMLQQTQVSVVQGYFSRWMERFPNVKTLANASVDEVIKFWEGLGYYSRARHLHAGAQYIIEHHGGALPSSQEELAKIKGLGPYTIGAIRSFAFRQKAAAVDGNTMRVLARYFKIAEDTQLRSTLKKIWEIAEEILPDDEPWIVVEGLIELGATVCKRVPDCANCPLQTHCKAFHEDCAEQLPVKGKKTPITALFRDVFVIVYQNNLLVKKALKGEIMADLYEFPYSNRKEKNTPFSDLEIKKIKQLKTVEQRFTRYKATLYPGLWAAREKREYPGYHWISWPKLFHYPFSSGHRKILNQLRRIFLESE